jgi:hypothetical protein
MRIIQQVPITADNTIYIIGYNEDTRTMQFRTSQQPAYLQSEQIEIEDDVVYTGLYHFPLAFLQKYLNECDSTK